MTAPTVSVLVAAYNAEQTIAMAVRSALAQTAHLHEVIVVDDASTDRTLDILHGIADPRLRVLRQSARQGPGVARNRAMEMATGQWLAILDADDAFEPQRLERLLAGFPPANEYTMLADHWIYCRSRASALVPWQYCKKLPPVLDLNTFLHQQHFLVKPLLPASIRDTDIRYPAYYSWEDAVFMCRLMARGYQLLVHSEPLYLYRLRRESLSHDLRWRPTMESVFTALFEELEPVLDDQGRNVLLDYIQMTRRVQHYLPVLQALRSKHYGQLVKLLYNDQSRRREFIRRIGPSVIRRLNMLRLPGTTGR